MHILNKLFIIFSLLSISICANATASPTIHSTSNTLGSANPDTFISNYTFATGDIIDDIYLFDINSATASSLLSTTATSIELGSSFGIDNFKFALTDDLGHQMSIWGSAGDSIFFSMPPSMATPAPMPTHVSGGTYGIHFTGTVSGLSGGIITGITAIAPVPVPASAWLLGSALLGLAGISRSRKKGI
ncbi:MAG: VPLPA-CTERM sorting domain-containing protein [Methylococcales bacterium]